MLVAPGVHVDHGEADYLLCATCYRDIEIDWGDNKTGFAICECGDRYAYKHVYDKFVRA